MSLATDKFTVPFGMRSAEPSKAAESVGERTAANNVSMRILTFSSLFPSRVRPRHGIFVETRLRHLIQDCPITARAIAPVPWFPFSAGVFGRYAAFAATPAEESRIDNRVRVAYPRYLMVPRLGVAVQPDSMARAAMRVVTAWRHEGWTPDIIDAHYFYPDGVAAALVAEQLGRPLIVTARGTDINVLAKERTQARRILWAAQRAAAVVAVSEGLKQGLLELGVDGAKLTILRNGVDLDVFRIEDPAESRRRLGLPDAPLLASVGNLVPEKDQALAIRTLADLPGCHLVIVGDGILRTKLLALARQLGLSERTRILPPMQQRELSLLYSSVDALLVTSTREGWPNVVLESMACGTPVVAMDVGAVKAMLTDPGIGRVVQAREPNAVADAVKDLMRTRATRAQTRLHASRFDWNSVSNGQLHLFLKALGTSEPRAR